MRKLSPHITESLLHVKLKATLTSKDEYRKTCYVRELNHSINTILYLCSSAEPDIQSNYMTKEIGSPPKKKA